MSPIPEIAPELHAYYCAEAKKEIQATAAARTEGAGIMKHGVGWSLYLAFIVTILILTIPYPFPSGWLYGLTAIPFIVAAVFWVTSPSTLTPAQAEEEARLAQIFAEEEQARRLHYRTLVAAQYAAPPPK